MLLRLCILTLLAFQAIAEQQLSLYGLGSVYDLQRPGAGVEYSTTAGNRAVVGGALELSEKQSTFERELRARLDLRLLFGAEQSTHWYPIGSAQWRFSEFEVEPWLGAGIEHKLVPQAGLFSDLLWQPFEAQVQARIGLRVWLSRFSTLDARINSARPLGAVYRPQYSDPKPRVTTAPAAFNNATTTQPKPEPPIETAVEATVETTRTPVEIRPVSNVNTSAGLSEKWHVQLGFFSQRASAIKLQADPRLDRYRDSVFTWYDVDRQGYRLLIGPISQVRARVIRQELMASDLESLLYRRPENE